MPGSVEIKNLRNIARLEFPIPDKGVWLLTAGNGAGKTSLLACLRRIRHANAFPIHFPSSLKSTQLDNYSNASITYSLGEEEVEYAYRGERWTPRPRSHSQLLAKFGYPNVIYIGATADRITPRPEDFVPARMKPAPNGVVAAANRICESEKFSNLKVVNLTTGVGNKAFVMRVDSTPPSYHSEKQFSLGELCVLKLITALADCPKRSLVLIDELEMALHPRAQAQLHSYLVEVAADKSLTVIFSTHSVSLLKSVPRKQIIYLDRDNEGVVTPVLGCFPAYAIGNITIGEERAPDVVLYVEDDAARALLEPLTKLVATSKFATEKLFPTVKVVPVGPFDAVIRFLTQHRAILPSGTKAFALLDKDVKDEHVKDWEDTKNYQQLKRLEDLKGTVDYLPWTPEVAIVGALNTERQDWEKKLRKAFNDPAITLKASQFSGLAGLTKAPLRKHCKYVFAQVCDEISKISARTPDDVHRSICNLYAEEYFSNNESDIKQLLASKLI